METNRNYQVRPTTWLQRSGQISRFALRGQWALTIGAAAVTTTLVLLIVLVASSTPGADVWTWVQNVATCFTLGTALLIWVSERAREWQSDLPKRLTAHFVFERNEVMVCEGAYLSSESDIRAWAQQLGSQMTSREQLSLLPKLDQEDQGVQYDEEEKCFFVQFDVVVYLREMPAALKTARVSFPDAKPLVHWQRPQYIDDRYPTGAPSVGTPSGRGTP